MQYNDAGIVWSEHPYIYVVLCKNTSRRNTDTVKRIREIAEAIKIEFQQ